MPTERLTRGRPLLSWARAQTPIDWGEAPDLNTALHRLRESGLTEIGASTTPVVLSWQRFRHRLAGGRLVVDAVPRDPCHSAPLVLLGHNPEGLVEVLLRTSRLFGVDAVTIHLGGQHVDLEVGVLDAVRAEPEAASLRISFEHNSHPSPYTERASGVVGSDLVHGLETWYHIGLALALDPEDYRPLAHDIALITLAGGVRRPGLVEAPNGIALTELIDNFGGGLADLDAIPQALALDGGMGGFLPYDGARRLDADDFLSDEVNPHPASVMVLEARHCLVDAVRAALYHYWQQSEDTAPEERALLARAARLVSQVKTGTAGKTALADLQTLSQALYGRGLAAAWPLASALLHFPQVWADHLGASHCDAGVCFKRPPPPCQQACPANLDIPSFIAHIGHHDHTAAVRVMVQDNPLPLTCGLVCPAPCEKACVRGENGEALFIRPMKAVASRHAIEEGGGYPMPEVAPSTGKRVAIIGSGPAGLACAYYLAIRGHAPEIFEGQAEAGGMLRYGIPAYRLPPALLDIELGQITRLGVPIHTNAWVDSLESLQDQGFSAVFIAPGFQLSRKVLFTGADLPFVLGGMDFLREVRGGRNPWVGPRVVVIGGGNVAIDVALTALRQGARHVDMVCLERRRDMPASHSEVETALAEGVDIRNGWGPIEVTPNHEARFQRCLRVFDKNHAFSPQFDPADILTLGVDQVFLAVGQTLDTEHVLGGKLALKRGLIATDSRTLETNVPGVFAGGDAVHGPRTAVAAVRAGKHAAVSIDAWLRGETFDPHWGDPRRRDKVDPLPVDAHERSHAGRALMPELKVAERAANYRQIELGLTDEVADHEANRCLRCDMCIGCGLCQLACSEMGVEALRMIETHSGRFAFQDFERPQDRCIGCGACAQVCPTGAIQMVDRQGERQTLITGTVVRRQPLVVCSRCGAPAQTTWQRRGVLDRVGTVAHEHMEAALCPDCTRITRAEHAVHV